MAASVLVDAAFLIALLSKRDTHHRWAAIQAPQFARPWNTCEAVLAEAFHVLGAAGAPALRAMLQRRILLVAFDLGQHIQPVLKLMQKYADLPMSVADACLVRMTEAFSDSLILTTDTDFRLYRRHSRQVVPCRMPD
jgi:predicted nucleic acid-binding protein